MMPALKEFIVWCLQVIGAQRKTLQLWSPTQAVPPGPRIPWGEAGLGHLHFIKGAQVQEDAP